MDNKVKSGKEILEDFFKTINSMDNIDKDIAKMLNELYINNKLSDTNIRNELQKLRGTDGNKN
jgi:hypothetical protein